MPAPSSHGSDKPPLARRDDRPPQRQDSRGRPQQRSNAPVRSRASDTPAPIVQPVKSVLFDYLESIAAISRGKGLLFLPNDFRARRFMQEAVRYESVYDPGRHQFQTGLIDGWDAKSGYGFLTFSHPEVKQNKFFFHAAGYEEPQVKATFPSEQAPFTVLSISNSKQPRETERVQHHKDKGRRVQRHCCPALQIDEPIAFARWNDTAKKNEYAGRWMQEWMYQRIMEVTPQLESAAYSLLHTYRLMLEVEGQPDGVAVIITNFPFVIASALSRLEPLLGTGQVLHIVDDEDPYKVYDRTDLGFNRQPLTRYAKALTKYLTDKAAAMPEVEQFTGETVSV